VTDFLGGGLVFAIAAVLWIAYLIPSWLRRRNFMATEHNTARLQQTIRVLVESEDAPEIVRADVSSRGVHEQHKALRDAESKARVAVQAEFLARTQAARDPLEVAALAKHRRRTQRLIAFIILLVSVLATAAGITLVGYTESPILLYVGLGSFMVSLVGLRILAAKPRTARQESARSVSSEFIDFAPLNSAPSRLWTPAPLPRPLHLEPGSLARATVDSADMATRLRQAAQEEALRDRLERAAAINRERHIAHKSQTAVPVQVSSPVGSDVFAELEKLGQQPTETINLDELYRRRAVGE
jgi:hypothetical protein